MIEFTVGDWQMFVENWVARDFPASTPGSSLEHLRREGAELSAWAEVGNWNKALEEAADVFLLACDQAAKQGVSFAEILAAKMQKNLRREWAEPDAQGVREHKREETTPR